jgi:hypothetical protein
MAILGTTTLTGCSSIPDFIAGNTLTVFRGTNAPTGWTKLTNVDNCTLRVVASGALSPGGSNPFTDVFTSRSMSGSVGGFSLATSQIPSHTHTPGAGNFGTRRNDPTNPTPVAQNSAPTDTTGSSQSHNHPLGSSVENFSIAYSDVIRCSKN